MVAVSLKKSFFQTEDGIRDVERSRGLGDVYKRQYKGSFVLSKSFCQERDLFIDFTWNEEYKIETTHQTDFLCIRCELVRGVPSIAKADCPPDERWIWIGHGETKCFQRGKSNKKIKVHFNLHKESRKPTNSMVDAVTSTGLAYTVEILQMNDGDKYVQVLRFNILFRLKTRKCK